MPEVFGIFANGSLVHGEQLAVLHENPAIDDGSLDVGAFGHVRQLRFVVVDRLQLRAVKAGREKPKRVAHRHVAVRKILAPAKQIIKNYRA
jgi:hypothetical protein